MSNRQVPPSRILASWVSRSRRSCALVFRQHQQPDRGQMHSPCCGHPQNEPAAIYALAVHPTPTGGVTAISGNYRDFIAQMHLLE